jgi:uncharacterized protein YdhG (YjbR/CyaY superfamily)
VLPSEPSPIDHYLDRLRHPDRLALQRVRELVHGVVPGIEEVISHGVPAFRAQDIMVCGLAADSDGCAYIPFSNSVLTELHAELRGFHIDRGAIRFTLKRPLPRAVVRTLVQTRIRQAHLRQAQLRRRHERVRD